VTSPALKEAEIDAAGMITWTLTLAPGEKRLLRTSFDVSYPEGKEISGL